jgi:hypothetical protein
MTDYELNPILDLIEKVRSAPEADPVRTARLRRLNALFVYFQYAVASVRLQEESIVRMAGGQHRNFATHAEYGDCLSKIYSSAIAAYSHLRTCLNFTRALIDDIDIQHQSTAFQEFRDQQTVWARELISKRDTIAAHPEQPNNLVWKPNMWSDDGRIRFAAKSRQVMLSPREDLEHLRVYLSELSEHLLESWRLTESQVSTPDR